MYWANVRKHLITFQAIQGLQFKLMNAGGEEIQELAAYCRREARKWISKIEWR